MPMFKSGPCPCAENLPPVGDTYITFEGCLLLIFIIWRLKKSVQGAAIMQKSLLYSSLLGNNSTLLKPPTHQLHYKNFHSCENSHLGFLIHTFLHAACILLLLFQSISITPYSLLCCRRAQVAPEVWGPALAQL